MFIGENIIGSESYCEEQYVSFYHENKELLLTYMSYLFQQNQGIEGIFLFNNEADYENLEKIESGYVFIDLIDMELVGWKLRLFEKFVENKNIRIFYFITELNNQNIINTTKKYQLISYYKERATLQSFDIDDIEEVTDNEYVFRTIDNAITLDNFELHGEPYDLHFKSYIEILAFKPKLKHLFPNHEFYIYKLPLYK